MEEADTNIAVKHISECVDCSKPKFYMHNTPVPKRVSVLFDNAKHSRKRLCQFDWYQNDDWI